MITYTKVARTEARNRELCLAKIVLNGQHAKRGSISISGAVGKKTEAMIRRLIIRMSDDQERMK
jgi:hypothetical protein